MLIAGRGSGAATAIGILGLVLIWKGITGDVMETKLGDDIVPRWMYIAGGIVLLAFPVMLFLACSPAGRAWLGIE